LTGLTTALSTTQGGTGLTSYSTGDLIYSSATDTLAKRSIGTVGQVLTVVGGVPTWVTPATGGSVTSVSGSGGSTGLTFSGGPITTSGTLTLGGTLAVANGGTGVTTFGGTNTILYTSSANTLSSITTANNGLLVTSATGVPSISNTLPPGVLITAGSGTATVKIGGLTYASSTAIGNAANTTENNLMSYSMPGNTLSVNNAGIRIRAWGDTAANSNSKTIRVYFGSTVLCTLSANASNKPWFLDAYVLRSGPTSQVAMGQCHFNADTSIVVSSVIPVETLSGAVTVKVTGQSGTANANNIVQKGLIVEFLAQ
jgi:hypothetical protein